MSTIAAALHAKTVLIVHENPFWGGYLADVLRAAGAIVTDPVQSAGAALGLIAEAQPNAVVLGEPADDEQTKALVNTIIDRGIVTLSVHSIRSGSRVTVIGLPTLTAPYAGYQVVEALATMVSPATQQSHGPTLRGH